MAEEELPRHFANGRNIGIVLGAGLSETDLDNPLAITVAEKILPDTLKSGREKRPHSHWWYLTDPIPESSRTYALPKAMVEQLGLDPGDATLVELRSSGRQTMVASSVHPDDGDRCLWHPGEIYSIEGKELEKLAREVAIATLLALHWPEGSRQRFVLYAASYLGRHMGHGRVEAILEAAAAAAEDEEHSKRASAVRDTLQTLSEGQEAVTGGPNLEELAPGVPAQIARWCGWRLAKEGKKNGVAGDDEDIPTHDQLCDAWLESREAPTAFGQGEWRRYGNGIWVLVHQQLVNREIDEILIEAKLEGVRPTSGMRSSVEKLARASAFVPDEAWDASEDLLVCSNGSLEISTGTLRTHRAEDLALSAVPYTYDPEAKAPTWSRFLASTIPEAATFLMEFAGYFLTGETLAEIAVWLYGPPGSGKSTFIEGLRAMLGPRAGILGLAGIKGRFGLSMLPGKTLVVATEQPSEFISATHTLNQLISGEETKVEEKFKPTYTAIPRAKLCWAANELPRVKDPNDGIFRRVRIVEFLVGPYFAL